MECMKTISYQQSNTEGEYTDARQPSELITQEYNNTVNSNLVYRLCIFYGQKVKGQGHKMTHDITCKYTAVAKERHRNSRLV